MKEAVGGHNGGSRGHRTRSAGASQHLGSDVLVLACCGMSCQGSTRGGSPVDHRTFLRSRTNESATGACLVSRIRVIAPVTTAPTLPRDWAVERLPAIAQRTGPTAADRPLEFFTAQIRDTSQRSGSGRPALQAAGYRSLFGGRSGRIVGDHPGCSPITGEHRGGRGRSPAAVLDADRPTS